MSLLFLTTTTLIIIFVMNCGGAKAEQQQQRSLLDGDLVTRLLKQHRRYIVDGFNNGTASFRDTFESAGEILFYDPRDDLIPFVH